MPFAFAVLPAPVVLLRHRGHRDPPEGPPDRASWPTWPWIPCSSSGSDPARPSPSPGAAVATVPLPGPRRRILPAYPDPKGRGLPAPAARSSSGRIPMAAASILRIGLPSSVGQALSALGFTVLQGVVNLFGTGAIAAFGVGNRLIGLFDLPAHGLSVGHDGPGAGQALGARDEDRRPGLWVRPAPLPGPGGPAPRRRPSLRRAPACGCSWPTRRRWPSETSCSRWWPPRCCSSASTWC
ncbi:MAG: hypothetical protein M0C28_22610 [Candidatus Moduliflexus flocculans]|nr:hypothetical protein [Candidatus Moduliflexus flocculans]